MVAGKTESYVVGNSDNAFLSKVDANGSLVWSYSYGWQDGLEHIDGLAIAPDSGIVFGGRAFMRGSLLGFLMKVDQNGNEVWAKGLGSTYATTRIMDVQPTSDQGFVTTGYTSIRNGAPNTPNDVFMAKFDQNGDTIWTKIYSSSITDNELGYHVIEKYDIGGDNLRLSLG